MAPPPIPAPPPPVPPPAASRPVPGAGSPLLHRLTFHGSLGTLLGIHVVNGLLAVLTLGIFQFWGRARVRRYILSQTAFAGDRFAYHGTGRELFIGFLKALLIFGVPVALLMAVAELSGVPRAIAVLARLAAYVVIFLFFAFAVVGAHRYRLARTSLRGVRFSFRGRSIDCARLFVKGALLTVITLGFYRPIFETQLRGFLTSNSYLGNRKFEFDGQGRDLLWPYTLAMLLFLPTLGLYTFWYLARKQRYLWAHTRFGTARFHSAVRGGRLLLFFLGNAAVLLLLFAGGTAIGVGIGAALGGLAPLGIQTTIGLGAALGLALLFGLGWPWMKIRTIRFTVAYLTVSGPLDFALIQQEAQMASPVGEALAGFFDVGFDFG